MEPDWERETPRKTWDPPKQLMAALRRYERLHELGGPVARVRARAAAAEHRLWSAVCGADIPLLCKIGGGFLMPHPNGIVIHPDSVIGVNCLFFQQVTVGASERGVPDIGDGVDVGAGAKIIGPIRVGDGARIGANAVVVHDVPAGATVVGVPAKVVSRTP